MSNLTSLSIFVGTGDCNGNCAHCAGKAHRKQAPKIDGIIDEELISRTLRDCYRQGARSLSISSSGEPTLSPVSVTRALRLINECRREGIGYFPVNLYSNGIRIGKDEMFCHEYLPLWKSLGLTRIYVTVHGIDEKKNAQIYRVTEYPKLETITSRIHEAGLLMRANIVLSRDNIGTYEKFVPMAEKLIELGADSISAWPMRTIDDKIDKEKAPHEDELERMESWIGERPGRIRLLRENSRILYETGRKLTLFPDGKLSGSWCN